MCCTESLKLTPQNPTVGSVAQKAWGFPLLPLVWLENAVKSCGKVSETNQSTNPWLGQMLDPSA